MLEKLFPGFIKKSEKQVQAEIPPGIKSIQITPRTLEESMIEGWDMSLGLLLRNMSGAKYDLGEIIRIVAGAVARLDKPLEVLEVSNNVPLKALYFQGYILRHHGDYLIYDSYGPHEKPQIHSTIVSNKDYVASILTNELDMRDGFVKYDILGRMLEPILEAQTDCYNQDVEVMKQLLMSAYTNKKEKGDISFYKNYSPVQVLRELYKQGKRFDLIFIDLPPVADRINCLEAVQNVLARDGYGYVPLTWWRPKPLIDKRVDHLILIDDIVQTRQGKIPLEDYLAQNYPEAFKIAHFPSAETLVIKGTEKPINLPNFDARLREKQQTNGSFPSLEWFHTK